MGCNCATTEQINELYRRFGEKRDQRKNFSLKYIFQKTLLVICMVFITPIIIFYVLGMGIYSKDRRISVRKFFNLKNHNMLTNVG